MTFCILIATIHGASKLAESPYAFSDEKLYKDIYICVSLISIKLTRYIFADIMSCPTCRCNTDIYLAPEN